MFFTLDTMGFEAMFSVLPIFLKSKLVKFFFVYLSSMHITNLSTFNPFHLHNIFNNVQWHSMVRQCIMI